jgi:hypothetical protein
MQDAKVAGASPAWAKRILSIVVNTAFFALQPEFDCSESRTTPKGATRFILLQIRYVAKLGADFQDKLSRSHAPFQTRSQ